MFGDGDDRVRSIGIFVLALAVVTGSGGLAGAVDGGSSVAGATVGDTIVVDDDGDADYRTIGAALEAATGGDRIVVRPGTYRESVTIRKDLELVAPSGATLSGTALGPNATAITVDAEWPVEPSVSGLAIAGYDTAVATTGTDADWTLADLRVRNVTTGIDASNSTGDWTVRDVRVRNVTTGIDASNSTGDWTVRDVRIRGASYGLYSVGSSGDWTVENATVVDARQGLFVGGASGEWTVGNSTFRTDEVGVYADTNAGRWSVRNSTFEGVPFGVYAPEAAGDWSVTDSTFRDGRVAVFAAEAPEDWLVHDVLVEDHAGTAVYAAGATGDWHVAESRIRNVTGLPDRDADWEGVAVYAPNATGGWAVDGNAILGVAWHGVVATGEGAGDATRNWWGGAGPACLGAVDCSLPLDALPGESDGPVVARTGTEDIAADATNRVTLSVAFDTPRERVAIFEGYEGPIESASVESVRIGDEPAGDRLAFERASAENLTVALTDVPADRTVTVEYGLRVAPDTSTSETVTFTGDTGRADVSSGELTAEFGTERTDVGPVVVVPDPPEEAISDADLRRAVVAWANGEISEDTFEAILVAWSS